MTLIDQEALHAAIEAHVKANPRGTYSSTGLPAAITAYQRHQAAAVRAAVDQLIESAYAVGEGYPPSDMHTAADDLLALFWEQEEPIDE